MHVHVIPLHEGWSVEETMRWLDQGLLLPDVDPPQWASVECHDDCDLGEGARFTFPESDHEDIPIVYFGRLPQRGFESVIDWIEGTGGSDPT
jgi:hypothetical protein